jgi:hypothetical protein
LSLINPSQQPLRSLKWQIDHPEAAPVALVGEATHEAEAVGEEVKDEEAAVVLQPQQESARRRRISWIWGNIWTSASLSNSPGGEKVLPTLSFSCLFFLPSPVLSDLRNGRKVLMVDDSSKRHPKRLRRPHEPGPG